MNDRFTMQVKGKFSCIIDNAETHCGKKEKANTFQYEVEIGCSTLDDEGFVVDNAEVKAYFDAMEDRRVTLSCEAMAYRACQELWRPNFSSIQVRIWGTDWANVACRHRASKDNHANA